MNSFWVLESLTETGSIYKGSEYTFVNSIDKAIRYGTKELAEDVKNRFIHFSNFYAVEYEVEYKRVGR